MLDGRWSVGRLYMGYLSVGGMCRWDNIAWCMHVCM